MPQAEQYDKITNGGVNTDNPFSEPYIGGFEGKEQNFKDNVYFAEKDKKLSNGEISKLKKNGIDSHDLKPHSDYDLYKDKKRQYFCQT